MDVMNLIYIRVNRESQQSMLLIWHSINPVTHLVLLFIISKPPIQTLYTDEKKKILNDLTSTP